MRAEDVIPMVGNGRGLPEFSTPPLVETVLTVQFEKIEGFRTVHAGLFWERLRGAFPDFVHVEEHAPVDQTIEAPGPSTFRSPGVRIELLDAPGLPRLFFLNHEKTQLIQLQPDRLSHSWRKIGDDDRYPRYERIRPSFVKELGLLERFLADEKLGVLKPIQAEISYINHIIPLESTGVGISPHGILRMWPDYRGVAGSTLEDAAVNLRHEIQDSNGQFEGRLFVSLKPAIRRSDNKRLLVLELLARGRPAGEGIDGAISFIDKGRQLVCRAFEELTTPAMQEQWGRIDGS